MRKANILFLLIILSSCGVYQSDFDCAPGKGIPCRSVTEIEKMIVETCEGPNVIVESRRGEQIVFRDCDPCSHMRSCEQSKRIWVEGKQTESGFIEGHYIYFSEEGR